jgi:CRISPR system Cascade subunit CasB
MPNDKRKPISNFVKYLTDLTAENDRGALAVLRRGLGYPPGEDVAMYRYIARFVPDSERSKDREKIYYLVAALYAFHQLACDEGNFGNHMAIAAGRSADTISTERRFTVLLNANISDLADYLRQAVSFLKAKEVPINWDGLFEDLKHWDLPDKPVQRRWANGFWAYQKPAD